MLHYVYLAQRIVFSAYTTRLIQLFSNLNSPVQELQETRKLSLGRLRGKLFGINYLVFVHQCFVNFFVILSTPISTDCGYCRVGKCMYFLTCGWFVHSCARVQNEERWHRLLTAEVPVKLFVGCCLCFSTHHMPYHVFVPSQMEHGPSSLLGWSLVSGFVDFFIIRGMFVCARLYAIIIFGLVPRKWNMTNRPLVQRLVPHRNR